MIHARGEDCSWGGSCCALQTHDGLCVCVCVCVCANIQSCILTPPPLPRLLCSISPTGCISLPCLEWNAEKVWDGWRLGCVLNHSLTVVHYRQQNSTWKNILLALYNDSSSQFLLSLSPFLIVSSLVLGFFILSCFCSRFLFSSHLVLSISSCFISSHLCSSCIDLSPYCWVSSLLSSTQVFFLSPLIGL